ncbi:cytokine receptor-like isoform X2 [Limulus polyphemus]|uniref:Cytokine receptor-like isoform X2 n=1 Tax=Limulus polyphemus TaxID=6850 RepID=A0ABM1SCU7_LIMPO|nr:cytokine receptor-like isoform X2 [Limulus polyphemus]
MAFIITSIRAWLGIFILCNIFLYLEGCGQGNGPSIGRISQDEELEAGSTLFLNCTVVSVQGLNSSNIFFQFNNSTLSQKLVFLLDSQTAQLRIPNVQIQHSGKYSCYIKPTDGDPTFICLSQVLVESKPQPVEKFWCVSESFLNLTCCWKPQYNSSITTYKLFHMWHAIPQIYDGISIVCPVSLNRTCCQWRLDTRPSYRRYDKHLYFQLHSTNKFGNLVEKFDLNHFENVISDAPLHLEVTNKTQNEITITWNHPKGFQFGEFKEGLHYQLRYRNANTQDEWKVHEVGRDKTEYTLIDLIPYTRYDIQLRCRSSKADPNLEKMWSEFTIILCRTDPDVPYLIPDTRKDAFEQTILHFERRITLYWKPVPKESYNGEDFYYVIECLIDHTSHPKQSIRVQKVEGSLTKYTFDHLELKIPYKFILYSVNKEGQSDRSSEIFVDSVERIIPRPANITAVSFANGTYKLDWDYPTEKLPITSFTVFWCNNPKPRPFTCNHPVSWKTFSAEINSAKFDFQKDLNYQFAVAANSERSTSGMEWAVCIVPAEKALDKVVIDVYACNESCLIVKWVLACKAQKKLIQEYIVQYCQSTLNQSCLEMVISDPHAEKVILRDGLQPFTKYLVSVKTKTLSGLVSEFSEGVLATTKAGTPTEPLNIQGKTNSTAISITWQRPEHPNGIIEHYIIWFNGHNKKVDHCGESQLCSTVIDEDIRSYTNYSISVQACGKYSCSKKSSIFYAMVGIRAPGIMKEPVVEILNTTTVRVRWIPPDEPNGPIDLYQLHIGWSNSENMTDSGERVYNVSSVSSLGDKAYSSYFSPDCTESDQTKTFSFQIQAINIENENLLKGPLSNKTETRPCIVKGPEAALVIGIVVGSCLGLVLLVFILSAVVRWMKKKVEWMNDIKVQLPSGLDKPHSLVHKKSRLCDKYRRNHSSDSNDITLLGGHESVSSVANRTHFSSDSGTEIDLHPPLSPEDSQPESSNHTPLSSGPGLSKVEEIYNTDSRDSGLDHDQLDDSREKWPISGTQAQHPYKRFDQVIGYVPLPSQNTNITSSHLLANSEPSIHDDEGVTAEDGSCYSRFGLAKSVGSVMEESRVPQSAPGEDLPNTLSYSKFGVISPTSHERHRNPTVGLVLNHSRPFQNSQNNCLDPVRGSNQPVSKMYVTVPQTNNFIVPHSVVEPIKPGLYSDFGVESKATESPLISSGYVQIQDNFNPEFLPEGDNIDNKGYSRFALDPIPDNDHCKPLPSDAHPDLDETSSPSVSCLNGVASFPQKNSNIDHVKSPDSFLYEADCCSNENIAPVVGGFPSNGYVQCPIHQYRASEQLEDLDLETPEWTSTSNNSAKALESSDPNLLSIEVPPRNLSGKNNGYVSWGNAVQDQDVPEKKSTTMAGLIGGINESEERIQFQDTVI